MKKVVFSLSLLAFLCFAAGLLAAPTRADEPAPQETEAAPAQPVLASVEGECSATAPSDTAAPMWPGPNYCGDPCTQEGQMVGCIDTSGPVWRRTICTCSNGHLVC